MALQIQPLTHPGFLPYTVMFMTFSVVFGSNDPKLQFLESYSYLLQEKCAFPPSPGIFDNGSKDTTPGTLSICSGIVMGNNSYLSSVCIKLFHKYFERCQMSHSNSSSSRPIVDDKMLSPENVKSAIAFTELSFCQDLRKLPLPKLDLQFMDSEDCQKVCESPAEDISMQLCKLLVSASCQMSDPGTCSDLGTALPPPRAVTDRTSEDSKTSVAAIANATTATTVTVTTTTSAAAAAAATTTQTASLGNNDGTAEKENSSSTIHTTLKSIEPTNPTVSTPTEKDAGDSNHNMTLSGHDEQNENKGKSQVKILPTSNTTTAKPTVQMKSEAAKAETSTIEPNKIIKKQETEHTSNENEIDEDSLKPTEKQGEMIPDNSHSVDTTKGGDTKDEVKDSEMLRPTTKQTESTTEKWSSGNGIETDKPLIPPTNPKLTSPSPIEADNHHSGGEFQQENNHFGNDKSSDNSIHSLSDGDIPSSGHFFAYFLTAVVICISGYVIFHNKHKILAFIIEGRDAARGGRRRTNNGVQYSQLKSNVEEVMPSLDKATTAKNFVY